MEMIRVIRNTRLLSAKYPCYEPEVKTCLHRWTFGHILTIAEKYKGIIEAGEPVVYEKRELYHFAFNKLCTAISYYRFLTQSEPHILPDPSYRGELPQWICLLIDTKRQSRLVSLLTDARAFTETDVDALLIFLGVVDEKSRKWLVTKPGKGGNQSAFPATYAALLEKNRMFRVPHVKWAAAFRTEYGADFSDSIAQKADSVDTRGRGTGVLNEYYEKAIQWLETPKAERKNL